MSCVIEVGVRGGLTGTMRRRNFLLRKVARPEPSTQIMYWSNCLTLRYHSSPIPFEGVVADLVLNSNGVTNFQWWQAFGTCGPAFFSFNMSDA